MPYENGFSSIPIQESGRIKPLDTFARNQMLLFYEKRQLKHEDLSAVNWLENLFTNTDSVFYKDIFNINNPEIVYTLGLEWTNNYHKYNYYEVLEGIKSQSEYFNSISLKSKDTDSAALFISSSTPFCTTCDKSFSPPGFIII